MMDISDKAGEMSAAARVWLDKEDKEEESQTLDTRWDELLRRGGKPWWPRWKLLPVADSFNRLRPFQIKWQDSLFGFDPQKSVKIHFTEELNGKKQKYENFLNNLQFLFVSVFVLFFLLL